MSKLGLSSGPFLGILQDEEAWEACESAGWEGFHAQLCHPQGRTRTPAHWAAKRIQEAPAKAFFRGSSLACGCSLRFPGTLAAAHTLTTIPGDLPQRLWSLPDASNLRKEGLGGVNVEEQKPA
jgi:hypothetical protein